jgi:hypothetical protein
MTALYRVLTYTVATAALNGKFSMDAYTPEKNVTLRSSALMTGISASEDAGLPSMAARVF